MTGIMLFMLYIYEFYTKFVRRKYEIILSVFLSVFAAAAVNVILNFLVYGLAGRQEQLTVVLVPVVLFALMCIEKLLLLRIMRKDRGRRRFW